MEKIDEDECIARLTALVPKMLAFLKKEANITTRGKKGEEPRQRTDQISLMANLEKIPQSSFHQKVIVMTELLALHMKCDFDLLFKRFPVS